MEVDEITVPSPDFPGGLSFGPVTLDNGWVNGVDIRDELPVTLTPRCCRSLGVRWYRERYRTRGVFTVMRNHILFTPTAPVVVERAGWWRRLGYLIVACWTPGARRQNEQAARHRDRA